MRKKENLNNKSIISPDFLIEKFYGDENITIDRFINILNQHSNYNVIEVMSHPGYLDCDTLNISSYNLQRLTELKTLTSKEVKNFIEENKIQVINFRDLM